MAFVGGWDLGGCGSLNSRGSDSEIFADSSTDHAMGGHSGFRVPGNGDLRSRYGCAEWD